MSNMAPKKSDKNKTDRISARVDGELREQFDAFCKLARQKPSDAIREILKMFLADGPEAAVRRFTSGVWSEDAVDYEALARFVTAGVERYVAEELSQTKGAKGKRRGAG